MGIYDPILQALDHGKVTDHSTHTTTQLPAVPQASGPGTGAIHNGVPLGKPVGKSTEGPAITDPEAMDFINRGRR